MVPDDAQQSVSPPGSLIVMIVLLKLAWMWQTARGTSFLALRGPFLAAASFAPSAGFASAAAFAASAGFAAGGPAGFLSFSSAIVFPSNHQHAEAPRRRGEGG